MSAGEHGRLSRRRFLQHGATGVGAAAVTAAFPFRETLGEELATIDGLAAGGFGRLARAYDLAGEVTYLNHASVGTIPRAVRFARQRYLETCESNPWWHIWGDAWKEGIAETRRKAAALLNCDSDQLAITHTTTEGFNTLAHGLELTAKDEVLFSSLNHVGASACWFHQAQRRGFRVRRFDFPVLDTPSLTVDDVVRLHVEQIEARTRVLVLPHIDNIVGLRHPVKEITTQARARGVQFIAIDGAQSVGMLPVDLQDLGVDFYATSAHKWLQAPKGLGLLYVRRSVRERLQPLSVTWGQKSWEGTGRIYEDFGTRDLGTVLALGDAIDFQQALGATRKEAHFKSLWRHARRRAEAAESLTWRSPATWSLGASLFAIGLAVPDAGTMFDSLYREHGFVVRPFQTQGLNSLRVSPNAVNTTAELDLLFDGLEQNRG